MVSCSWNICDYRSVWTFRESVEQHQARYDKCAVVHGIEVADRRYGKDWRDLYREWARYYLWK
jgi:hypothetical protein